MLSLHWILPTVRYKLTIDAKQRTLGEIAMKSNIKVEQYARENLEKRAQDKNGEFIELANAAGGNLAVFFH
jgi:hypothetical protein